MCTHTPSHRLSNMHGEPCSSWAAGRTGFPVHISLESGSLVPAGETGRASQSCLSSPPAPRASRKPERKGRLGGSMLAGVCLQPLGSSHQQAGQVACNGSDVRDNVPAADLQKQKPLAFLLLFQLHLSPTRPHRAMTFISSPVLSTKGRTQGCSGPCPKFEMEPKRIPLSLLSTCKVLGL